MTTSSDMHNLTGAYVLDAMSGAELDAFEQHLRSCASCTQEIEELRTTVARLAVAVTRAPTPAMRERVLAGIKDVRQHQASTTTEVTPIRRRRRVRIAAGIVAAAAAVAIGLGVAAVGWQPDQHSSQARQAGPDAVRTASDATTGKAASTVGGWVTAVVSRDRGKAVVTGDGLPPLDRAHGYQVWVIGPGGPRSAGVLPAGGPPMVLTDISAGDNVVAITTEPAGGSPGPTTPVIVKITIA